MLPSIRREEESQAILARGLEGSKERAGAIDHAQSILESVLQEAPTTGSKSAV
jgi:hypothetical protein